MAGENRKLALGLIGCGGRGRGLLGQTLRMDDIEIIAVCDLVPGKMDLAVKLCTDAGRKAPQSYTCHHELLARPDIEAVVIATDWLTHLPIAFDAMRTGKYTGFEVGGAYSIEQCWELVRLYESTGTSAMMLENCCYGRTELALLNMVRQGVLGELIHCRCGYCHDIRDELGRGYDNGHYRQDEMVHRNADIYPTHGLGPIANLLSINRGNRMATLTSMSTKARGLHEWAIANLPEGHLSGKPHYNQGDVVTTMIKCVGGESILITHDTSLPRPYSRAGYVQGTRGLWMEDGNQIHIEGMSPAHEWQRFDPEWFERWDHPLWVEYAKTPDKDGHGGMDHLVLRAFYEAAMGRTNTPIDVYDAAAWMSVTTLSEQSIALGSASLPMPDFTNGMWQKRKPEALGTYTL